MKAAEVEASYVLRKDNRNLDGLPGGYGLPFLGQILPLLKDPFPVMQRQYERFGPVSGTRLLGNYVVWALGPEFNRELVMDPQQVYSARMGYEGGAAIMGKVGGEMMITDPWVHGILNPPKWAVYALYGVICGPGMRLEQINP